MWRKPTSSAHAPATRVAMPATTRPRTHFVSDITRFNGGHPEFAASPSGSIDPGTIKLNHAIHLKHNLRGPNGMVQLDCDDCHRTVRPESRWRFGSGEAQAQPG